MTDKEKFYRLTLNILNYEPKEVICYNSKLSVINIYLGNSEDYQLQFRLPKKELWLYLNAFNAYQINQTDQVALEYIIKVLQDNPIGKIILKGIE